MPGQQGEGSGGGFPFLSSAADLANFHPAPIAQVTHPPHVIGSATTTTATKIERNCLSVKKNSQEGKD